ncbi:MAG TPA: hypothetical protein VMX13_09025 [Sedimentisphaerales bacterium]|nr:hypothetical protein [Sedimentisphaerales bacterium]
MFEEEELWETDVIDVLLEEQIYDDNDMASEIVSNAWTELRRRQSWIGTGSPFSIMARRISRIGTWRQAPAHSFCLILSLSKWYRPWARQFGSDYTEQGELFEEVIKESLVQQFRDWEIIVTGWSRTRRSGLTKIVNEIGNKLGESVGNISRWTNESAKDAELDMLCYRPFVDGRVGIPLYLFQCASGADWDNKLHTPRIEIWKRLVEFAAIPKKGFAIPFALLDGDFVRSCNLVDGIVIDRYRILAAVSYKQNWVSSELSKRLITWSKSRIAKLPRLED